MNTLDQPSLNQDQNSYRQIAMNFGLIGALVSIVLTLITYLGNFGDPRNPNYLATGLISIASLGVYIFFMLKAVNKHRDENLGGYITFGKAFGVAFLTGLIMAVIGSIFNFIYFQFIDASYLDNLLEFMYETLESSGADPEPMMGFYRNIYSPIGMLISGLISGVLVSALFGLIPAAIGQKKPPQI